MIAGINGHICNFCIEQAHGIVAEEGKEKVSKDPKKLNLLKPAEIKSHLDEHAIGQDVAKKISSTEFDHCSGKLSCDSTFF